MYEIEKIFRKIMLENVLNLVEGINKDQKKKNAFQNQQERNNISPAEEKSI